MNLLTIGGDGLLRGAGLALLRCLARLRLLQPRHRLFLGLAGVKGLRCAGARQLDQLLLLDPEASLEGLLGRDKAESLDAPVDRLDFAVDSSAEVHNPAGAVLDRGEPKVNHRVQPAELVMVKLDYAAASTLGLPYINIESDLGPNGPDASLAAKNPIMANPGSAAVTAPSAARPYINVESDLGANTSLDAGETDLPANYPIMANPNYEAFVGNLRV